MTAELIPGAMVQYRRVGTARLVKPMEGMNERGWWELEWVKAPKVYRDKNGQGHHWWIDVRDLIA